MMSYAIKLYHMMLYNDIRWMQIKMRVKLGVKMEDKRGSRIKLKIVEKSTFVCHSLGHFFSVYKFLRMQRIIRIHLRVIIFRELKQAFRVTHAVTKVDSLLRDTSRAEKWLIFLEKYFHKNEDISRSNR